MNVALLSDPVCQEHVTVDHPENQHRLEAIERALVQSDIGERVLRLPGRRATVDDVATVHSRSYIGSLEAIARRGGGLVDADTQVAAGSYRAALAAAGCAICAVDAVLSDEVQAAFALVRPPGHHACRQRGMGFCLFNNLAIAAHHALAAHGLERVLIADFDVHHGNGIQEAFYGDGRVMYFSTHQAHLFPGTGAYDETGEGAGAGTNVNVPLPAGTGDDGFRQVYHDVLAPLAQRFRPQLILAAAGYDVHWTDPLGGLSMSVSGVARLVSCLRALAVDLCRGRLVLVLEGGYQLSALAASTVATMQVLLGDEEIDDPLGPYPGPATDISAVVSRVRQIHGLC